MSRTRKAKKHIPDIQHHHMLLRMETKLHPTKSKLSSIKHLIKGIVSDLHSDILGGPYIYYQGKPHPHKGITGICSIQTSHISFHFWDTPSPQTLNHANSRSLLQFDVYTCGSLTLAKAMNVIRRLQIYQPTEIDVDIMNRKHHLKIDHTLRWNDRSGQSFEAFLDTH